MSGGDKVIIIGGGLSGLAAGHYLSKRGIQTLVLEQNDRVGGRAKTEVIDGLPVDLGAQFIADFYHTTLSLKQELGIEEKLLRRSQRAFVLRSGTVEPIWPAPDLIKGSAMPTLTKLRLLRIAPSLAFNWHRLDISHLVKSDALDVRSAAEYVQHTMGEEALDYFFAPLLRGLLYWDADSTSQSVVLSLLKAALTYSKTYRMRDGIEQLAHAFAARQTVETGTRVESIKQSSDQIVVYTQTHEGPREVSANAVICAVPATRVNEIVPFLPVAMRDFTSSVTYTQTAILTFHVSRDSKDYPAGATLFPVSIVDDLASVNPCYSSLHSRQTASDRQLLNVYLSNSGYSKYRNLSDGELGKTVLRRIRELLGRLDWLPTAELANVCRWEQALPRFKVGHINAIENFISEQKKLKKMAFAGDYLGGPFIDGAVNSGIAAAKQIESQLL